MKLRPALCAVAISLIGAGATAKTPLEDAGAAGAAKPARQCFWSSQVNNFASVDDRVVNVRVGVKDVYRLEMFGHCNDLSWNNRIAIVSRGGSSICSGLDAEIISPSTIGPQRCKVQKITKLTPAEIAALPKGARP